MVRPMKSSSPALFTKNLTHCTPLASREHGESDALALGVRAAVAVKASRAIKVTSIRLLMPE